MNLVLVQDRLGRFTLMDLVEAEGGAVRPVPLAHQLLPAPPGRCVVTDPWRQVHPQLRRRAFRVVTGDAA